MHLLSPSAAYIVWVPIILKVVNSNFLHFSNVGRDEIKILRVLLYNIQQSQKTKNFHFFVLFFTPILGHTFSCEPSSQITTITITIYSCSLSVELYL